MLASASVSSVAAISFGMNITSALGLAVDNCGLSGDCVVKSCSGFT